MGYHPRIEAGELTNFVTTRSRNSELWLINNMPLEASILGYAAKYSLRYGVKLYALALEGNHIQGPADFPECNRGAFMRDFNSSVARAVPRYVPEYTGGKFWGKRYSNEFLPGPEDIEEYFFYTVLQPIKDGLVEKLSEYPGYNCFHDAIYGIERKYTVVRWREFNIAKKRNPTVSIKDYLEEVILQYQRLPGYEKLSQREYAKIMLEKLEKRRLEIVRDRKAKGLGFVGKEKLREIPPGARPHKTKTSTKLSHRPRILCICPQRRAYYLSWYFSVYEHYRHASARFRLGILDVDFPLGTYRPYSPFSAPP